MPKGAPIVDDNPSVKALNDPNVDDNPSGMVSPIVQSVDINTKSTSYAGVAGASTKKQPKVNSKFHPLVADLVFNDVNISIPRKVVKKKWSMRTSLLKEELTRIAIWVKLHDVPLQVFEEDGISLIATFIGKPIMLDSYTSSICNDSWGRSSFVWPTRCDICKIFGHIHEHCPKKMMSSTIVSTLNVVTPTVEKSNDGFSTVGKKNKKKGKSKSTNGGQFAGLSTTVTSSKNDNIITSNAYSALNDEEEEVENVYDESANLFLNTNTGGSSSFTVVAG
nr:hypothetical protein [Tanacetum cinerariifolium]GEY06180.1 hypothetical protein [Tanacetum cinerariifolium]